MERWLIPVVFAFVLGGVYYYNRFYKESHDIEMSSGPFVISAVRDITNGWNEDTFKSYADAQLGSQSTVGHAFSTYRLLGAVREPATCKMTNSEVHRFFKKEQNYYTADFECQVQFAAAPAVISVNAYRFKDASFWKISYFNVVSSLFVPQPN